MSVHAISWVLRNSETRLGQRLVLLVLADHADGDGAGACPAVETIANEARLSERQARRALRDLEAGGSIVKTGQALEGMNVYRVVLRRGDILSGPGGVKMSGPRPEMSPEALSEDALSLLPPPTAPVGEENGSSTRPRPRDLLWDVFDEELGQVTNAKERGRRNGALRAIRESLQTMVPEGQPMPMELMAAELRRRIETYRSEWPKATLTEQAIASNWTRLGGLAEDEFDLPYGDDD